MGSPRSAGASCGCSGCDAHAERREIKSRIGVVPQETNLDTDLTVRENLTLQARYFGTDSRRAEERADELLDFAILGDRASDRIVTLSGGMKRRLLVARALINDPELVVLDEPTTGLDPQARLGVWRALERLRQRGVTLLLTTHYMEEAARLCDRLLIMDEGRDRRRGRARRAGRPSTSAARCSSCSSGTAATATRSCARSTGESPATSSPTAC